MLDGEIAIIVALLPLAAAMVVFQTNPYYALVVRGILGAIAALVYAVLGAADVALTEALVGTMLAITLYAVAVRSSLVMRLGVVASTIESEPTALSVPIGADGLVASSSPPESPAPLSELNPAAWLPESASCPLPSRRSTIFR
ncbi:MAG: DUF4040 domain-containing protein, partial [Spirulinaceae cyanobacterium SM2_1_0]|nr:DUF4040 domain-containing protein [Spirulinaceae cyanobacterium SM2_1_0]